MSDMFARLVKLSDALNVNSDSVSEALKTIEGRLASLRLGVEVWLPRPLKTEPAQEDTISTYLGYAKVDGTWHLATRSDYEMLDGNSEKGALFALQQASREDRIEALKRMPELLKEIEERAQAEVKKLQSALAIAKEL
jgi:hypothetical protein